MIAVINLSRRWTVLIALLLLAAGIALAQGNRQRGSRERRSNVQFVDGHSALNIPFEFEFNEIVLKVRVNNSPPVKFMFDTGAGLSVAGTRLATALHLKKVDTVKATGVGGSVAGSLASGISLSVPGVTVRNQRLALLPLEFPFCEGKEIQGIIGYDFIRKFVVKIDYDARTISFFDPQSYQYQGPGDVIPLIIRTTPFVRARVAASGRSPIEGLFEIDTGSDGALSINSPFVNRHQLLNAARNQSASSEKGLGGESERVLARIDYFQLGRFKLASPIVSFSTDTEGSLASTENDGPIGNEIMRRFKVTIDYSRQRMILEPNEHVSEAFEDDMSGLTIDSEGLGCRIFKVSGVNEKSPAAEAGVLAGDEIVAIDGKPAGQFTSSQIEKMLMQNGAEVSLTIRRNGSDRIAKIKLRRLT